MINLNDYTSRVKFVLDKPNIEGWPRSSNIAEIGFSGSSSEWPLMVRFFKGDKPDQSSVYVYRTQDIVYRDKITGERIEVGPHGSAEIWTALIAGAQYPGKNRNSTGRSFFRLVKSNDNKEVPCPYQRIALR